MAERSPSQGASASPGLAPSSHPTPGPHSVTPTPSSRPKGSFTPQSLSHSPHSPPECPHLSVRVLPCMPTILLSHLTSGFLRAGVHSHLAMVYPRPCHPGDRPGSHCSGRPDLVSHPSPEQEGEFPAPLAAQPPAQPGAAPGGQHAENGECPRPGSRRGQLEGQP